MFDLDEIEQAFRLYWSTGIVRENWNAWADLFTEDVVYEERILGTMRGRETVRTWIVPLMERYGEIYGVYDWHQVDPSGRVVFRMTNRRDLPGGGTLDFPGVSILQYAGNMQWSKEEDYWDQKLGVAQFQQYEEVLSAHPGHREKRTRLNWGDGPAWTRGVGSFWDHDRERR